MVLVYLDIYKSDLYKFGISLKRSYIAIRRCGENVNIRIFYMNFYLQKLRDPRKYCFYRGDVGLT